MVLWTPCLYTYVSMSTYGSTINLLKCKGLLAIYTCMWSDEELGAIHNHAVFAKMDGLVDFFYMCT